jgi:hypothetical protein
MQWFGYLRRINIYKISRGIPALQMTYKINDAPTLR